MCHTGYVPIPTNAEIVVSAGSCVAGHLYKVSFFLATPVLRLAPCGKKSLGTPKIHVGGSGGIALHILNHGTKWKWVANFTPRSSVLVE